MSGDSTLRRSLARLLARPGYETLGFDDAEGFLASFDDHAEGCLVVQPRLPGMSGLALQDLLRERGSRVPIVFVARESGVATAVRAMKSGAEHFLEIPFDARELTNTVHTAIARYSYAREQLQSVERARSRYRTLTRREGQVLALVVRGESNRAVGEALGIREKTVKVHRGQAMRKMAAGSFAELVELARIAGVQLRVEPSAYSDPPSGLASARGRAKSSVPTQPSVAVK